MEEILEFIIEFILEVIFGAVDETTKKYKRTIRRTIITVFAISTFSFLIAIPILGETGGKSVLGLVLISLLPIEFVVMIVIFIISKLKKKK
jgi:hypothetical protein